MSHLTLDQKKFCHATIAIVLLFFVLTGIWAVDIGASGMVLNEKYNIDLQVENGWVARSPMQHYHIGLWLIGISTMLLCILLMWNIIVNKKIA